MKKSLPPESAAAKIDAKIAELGDWRGETLATALSLIAAVDIFLID